MLFIYIGVTIFCLVFFLIYNCFSHGVHSLYMTWLFAWPLVLGVFPSTLIIFFKKLRRPDGLCINIWNSGVAAVTVSSMLRGIFEIAGTGSEYQKWLMRAGALMLAAAAAEFILKIIIKENGEKYAEHNID